MNLLVTSVRRDLPPEIDVTREFFLSFRRNVKISLKPCAQEERFEIFPFKNMTCEFFKNS